MNEEMRDEELETIETEEVTVDEPIEEVVESGGGLSKLVVVTICAVGAAGAYLYKTRKQRKEKKKIKLIQELEAEGYTIFKGDIVSQDDEISEDQVEEEN